MSNLQSVPYVLTASGQRVDLIDPKPESIKLDDIAKALSLLNRFCGNTRVAVSVGWHSLNVVGEMQQMLDQIDKDEREASWTPIILLAALLHDAHEYVTGDVPAPVKRLLQIVGNLPCGCSHYEHIQQDIDRAIFQSLGYTDILRRAMDGNEIAVNFAHIKNLKIVGTADKLVALKERATFLPDSEAWPIVAKIGTLPEPPPAAEVEQMFKDKYVELFDLATAASHKMAADIQARKDEAGKNVVPITHKAPETMQ